jgi:hypothetical protein
MPQQWNDTWKRNTHCEITGQATTPGTRKECMYCPVVVRLDAFKSLTLRYMSKQWICPECILDIKANRDELCNERRVQLETLDLERSARLVQAHIRGWLPRQRYLHAREGSTKFSALFRGKMAREKCHKRFSGLRRVMRIKTVGAERLSAADSDGLSDPYVHIGVVSGSNSDVQIFHHETKPKRSTLASVHSLYTHCALTVHSLYTHCAPTVHPLCTHCTLTVHSLCTHCALTIHSLCTHCTLTVHSLCTVHSLYTHYTLTTHQVRYHPSGTITS